MLLQDEVRAIVRAEGVIARRGHAELAGAITALLAAGELVPVLPGVYTVPSERADVRIRLLALALREPDAILTGDTAARLTYWADLSTSDVGCAVPWQRVDQPGFRFSRRRIPAELVADAKPLKVTDPALTALDLCATRGGDGIDRALRARVTTLAKMRRALELTRGRPGNVDRRALLLDSRDEPWSAAERLCHRLLRAAGLTGWRSNHPVDLAGARYYLDVAFPLPMLAVEIDGRLHEDDPDVFENDRRRQNALVVDGWTVLRFTWRMLEDEPEAVVKTVRTVLTLLSSPRSSRLSPVTPASSAGSRSGARK